MHDDTFAAGLAWAKRATTVEAIQNRAPLAHFEEYLHAEDATEAAL